MGHCTASNYFLRILIIYSRVKFLLQFFNNYKPLKAIKKEITQTKIFCCFFHYSQLLWRKANKLHLKDKNAIEITKDLILNLKVLHFTDVREINERFKKLKSIFNTTETTLNNSWNTLRRTI